MSDNSSMYQKLHTAASTFVLTNKPISSVSDNAAMLSARSPECQVHYAPSSYQSLVPQIRGSFSNDQYTGRMAAVFPLVENVHIEIKEIIVDEAKKSVVVWAVHCLTPKRRTEAKNEFMWLLNMDETGEKVKKAVAFVDTAGSVEFFKDMGAVAKEIGVELK
jgi:hypothetical protein